VAVTGARSGGLVVDKGSRRVAVRDFASSDNEFDGLGGYETEDSLFTGLFLHDNNSAGLTFDDNFNHNTISEALIDDNDHQGLFMRYSRDNLFSDIQIRNSGLSPARKTSW
jgi:Right handed beta helix region